MGRASNQKDGLAAVARLGWAFVARDSRQMRRNLIQS
jgi:hypothetical protein